MLLDRAGSWVFPPFCSLILSWFRLNKKTWKWNQVFFNTGTVSLIYSSTVGVSSPQGGDDPERRGDRSGDRCQNHERRRGRPQWWDEAPLTRCHQKVLEIIIWAQNQNEILCLSEMLIRNFPLKMTFLSWTPIQTGRQVRRLHCVTPWTVRDQILEISAARLHILRLPTRVASDCLPWRCYWLDANGKFFFFLLFFGSPDPRLLKNTVSSLL